MYIDYWHLKEKPFENVLDFKFVYTSPSLDECLARVSYAVTDRKGGAVLSGPAGSGKTTIRELLIQKIKKAQGGKRHFCSIVHPLLGLEEIIHECLSQLGTTDYPASKPQLLRLFGNKLLEAAEKNEPVVLIIDDAHMMTTEALNEIKLLLNLHDYSQRLLFTTIMIGESDDPAHHHQGIMTKLAQVPGLRQRLNIVVPMPRLSKDEVGHYIQHRIEVAGGKKPLFTPEAVEGIYRYSKGNPRETNNVCDLALLIGFGERLASVDAALIKRVVADISGKARHEHH